MRCRGCRYKACLSKGMNPLLVDSCKNNTVKVIADPVKEETKTGAVRYFADEEPNIA